MRINGTTGAGRPDRTIAMQGGSPTGALILAGCGEGLHAHLPPPPHVPPDGFAVVHDSAHGAVVIDLWRAALRIVESPTYHLSREGTFEIGASPLKGSLIDMKA